MNLYDGRNKIILEDKSITSSVYAYNAKSEPKEYGGVKESEQKSVESNLLEDKSITSSVYAYNAKSEPKEYGGVKESEQKSVESIGERVKLRRQ